MPSSSHTPKAQVGIVVPCYNLGAFIRDALKSIESQTFQDFELVIVDDCSTDKHTLEVLKSLQPKKGTVHFETKNLGLVNLVNKYYTKLDTEYLIVVSADDTIEPTYLEKAVKYLEKNRNKAAVCTSMKLFGERTGVHSFTDEGCQLPHMLIQNYYCGTALLRKAVWLDVGKYDSSLPPHEDYVFWLALLQKGYQLGVISEPLFNYRIRSVSMSNSTTRKRNNEFKRELAKRYSKLYQEHWYFVLAHAWEIIEKYDTSFEEYQAGHDWLDREYRLQLEEIALLKSKIERLKRNPGVRIAMAIRAFLLWLRPQARRGR